MPSGVVLVPIEVARARGAIPQDDGQDSNDTAGFFSTTAPRVAPGKVAWDEIGDGGGATANSCGCGPGVSVYPYNGCGPATENAPASTNYFIFGACGSGSGGVTLTYTLGGTAASTSDYTGTLLTGSVYVPINQTAWVPSYAVDDLIVEPTETVVVTIQEDYSSYYLASGPATQSILDNDTAQIAALHVENVDNSTEQATVTGGGTGQLTYTPRDPYLPNGDALYGRLHLSAALSGNEPAAWNLVKHRILDELNATVAAGGIGQAGVTSNLELTGTIFAQRTIEAWVDRNSNGIPDGLEDVTRLLATTNRWHVRTNSNVNIVNSLGIDTIRVGIEITEGDGRVVVTSVNAQGKDVTQEIPFAGATKGQPWGTVLQGNIKTVRIFAGASTTGTSFVETP